MFYNKITQRESLYNTELGYVYKITEIFRALCINIQFISTQGFSIDVSYFGWMHGLVARGFDQGWYYRKFVFRMSRQPLRSSVRWFTVQRCLPDSQSQFENFSSSKAIYSPCHIIDPLSIQRAYSLAHVEYIYDLRCIIRTYIQTTGWLSGQ